MLSNWQSVLKATSSITPKPFKKALKKYIGTLEVGDKKTLQEVQKEIVTLYREELINDGMRPSSASVKIRGFKSRNYQGIINNHLKKYSNIRLYKNAGGNRLSRMEVIE
jgi:site-specific recombinase XerD